MRKCMLKPCATKIPMGNLFCKPHWFAISWEAQKAVTRSLTRYKKSGARADYVAYVQAVNAAVKELE